MRAGAAGRAGACLAGVGGDGAAVGGVGGPAPQRRPCFPGHAALRRRRQATLRALCRTKLRAREWQLLVARRSGAFLRLGTLEPMTRWPRLRADMNFGRKRE